MKICGITRREDLYAAADAGADAFGLVFYARSPRCLTIERALELRRAAPPLLDAVALFVNPGHADVERVVAALQPDLLQFHGEETPDFCRSFGRRYIKACRVRAGVDLLECWAPFSDACGWLADAWVEAYGGTGTTFDWSMVPAARARPLILSGGLAPENVGEAIRRTRPWAVDVSSGVEAGKGVKDAARIAAFIAEVCNADG